MAHGHPDYGVSGKSENIFKSLDVGELAARLGSVVTYNRLGNVVFADNFSHGFSPWIKNYQGGGADLVLVTDPTFTGSISAKITCPFDGDYSAGLSKRLWGVAGLIAGVHFSFSGSNDLNAVDIGIKHYTGTMVKVYAVRLQTIPSNSILCYTPSGWVKVAAFGVSEFGEDIFIDAKLVANDKRGYYRRLYLGDKSYYLGSLQPYSAASPNQEGTEAFISAIGDYGINPVCIVDRCVVTVNEY